MANNRNNMVINLTAVIVAVTNDTPRVLLVNQSGVRGLPSGPFDPVHHASLESGLRGWVEAQTGLDLYYVEQLYTFGNRNRDPREIEGGPRVVSVAYIALTHEDAVGAADAEWRDWYSFLPWEDWRFGCPAALSEHIEPALQSWVKQPADQRSKKQREERVNVTFGQADASDLDLVLALERYELLYEAGIVTEAQRDANAAGINTIAAVDATTEDSGGATGTPLASDHRRILATALGRLRGKLAYRPVVFELMPGEFTLLQLQRVVEALGGVKLHKQNFRRLVTNADLVEPVGRTSAVGRGRPAELFRFRREVLSEKLTVGVSRPTMRSMA
ncbi:MAG: hypothetical protein OEU90_11625 [Gammaproteobacteria bacterium]|nr:hypothetical protein [Gammaproteobacteria bacterium]MDH3750692.1 hypothetical protein [Gammaproteobacteria bacterium]MDH3806104.1 hypothetical protein [Gammaproteobacteria bacterium]